MKPTVHILPYQGLGGAELAALSAANAHSNLSVFFLKGTGAGWLRAQTYRDLLAHLDQTGAKTAVFSLWKTALAMIVVRLFRPKIRRAMFLHNDRPIHFADRAFSQTMSWFADTMLADSNSAARRFPLAQPRVVSFVLKRLSGKPQPVQPKFIFWGRLTEQKNLLAALETFILVRHSYPKAQFTIIGPDGGDQTKVLEFIKANALTDCTILTGEQTQEQIATLAQQHSFYLQPSLYEGMAMSVVEAMQMGLIVVATPVGEIATYLKDGENGIRFASATQSSDRIINLLKDPKAAMELSKNAQSYWLNAPLYADDFAAALAEVGG